MPPHDQRFRIANAARAWWRAVLSDRVIIVAVIMTVGALIAAVTAQPDAPLWKRGVVVGALSIL
ncbi:hypothetical protein [Roseiflexus castenholzii]|uniref:hypothetical protein n=1 Tax=Roseiflexus castenholzii TaxID=120962 RepID=UPI003C7C705C